jgi:proteasome lid subunit RPN8/RPN11
MKQHVIETIDYLGLSAVLHHNKDRHRGRVKGLSVACRQCKTYIPVSECEFFFENDSKYKLAFWLLVGHGYR